MKFTNTRVYNFEKSLRGMRNAKNSWHLSDFEFSISKYNEVPKDAKILTFYSTDKKDGSTSRIDETKIWKGEIDYVEWIKIGNNDMKLAQTLIRSGSCHSKFARQIFVTVDITAPLYFWKEMSTYCVGCTYNSTSTMHKLASTPITRECFEIDDYENVDFKTNLVTEKNKIINYDTDNYWDDIINHLEELRQKFNETKDKKYWKELVRSLPDSWLQTRTSSMNYKVLMDICAPDQRRNHKLNEWSGLDKPDVKDYFIKWARSLPYAQELIFYDEYLGIKRFTLDENQIEYLTSKGIDINNLDKQIKNEGWKPFEK